MTNASLLQPLQSGDIIIQNRIGMTALPRSHAPNIISDLMTEHDIQRTLGGAGLMTEGILVTRQGYVQIRCPVSTS